MKYLFILFVFFFALNSAVVNALECTEYKGLCMGTNPFRIYDPVLVKTDHTKSTYRNGYYFPPTPDYIDYQQGAQNICKRFGGRLPNNEELEIIADYFKSIPIRGVKFYLWSSEKESETFGYALMYNAVPGDIQTLIFGNSVSRSEFIEAVCVK